MLFNKNSDGITEDSYIRKYYYLIYPLIGLSIFGYFMTSLYLAKGEAVIEKEKQVTHRVAVTSEMDRNFEEAGIQYQKNAELATDKIEQAYYLVRSGNALNRSGDYAEGFSILKSVDDDASLPAELRAEARFRMLQPYFIARLKEPLQIVFSDPKYNTLLGGGSSDKLSDLEKAMRKSLEDIYAITPSSYIGFLISSNYAAEALGDERLTLSEKNDLLEKALEVMKVNDTLSRSESVNIEAYWNNPYPQDFAKDSWFSGQHVRFVALSLLARMDKSLVKEVESSYAALLPYYEGDRSLSRKSQQFWTNFYYAAFLTSIYGENKASLVTKLVEPYYETTGDYGEINTSDTGFWFFLRKELLRPEVEQTNNTRFIYEIASLVPAFDSFILSQFLSSEI